MIDVRESAEVAAFTVDAPGLCNRPLTPLEPLQSHLLPAVRRVFKRQQQSALCSIRKDIRVRLAR